MCSHICAIIITGSQISALIGLGHALPIYISHLGWNDRYYHHTQLLLVEIESHILFSLGWP
jgi:hypothetical protein